MLLNRSAEAGEKFKPNGILLTVAGLPSGVGSTCGINGARRRDSCYYAAVKYLWMSGRLIRILSFSFGVLLAAFGQGQMAKAPKSEEEVKQAIIAESIADYRANRGNCPCPYNTDRAGHRCGARSAYSRPGGASPICYAKDVTQKMVDEYRKRNQ